MQKFKLRDGQGGVYYADQAPTFMVSDQLMELETGSPPRPNLVAVSDSEPMLHWVGQPKDRSWFKVSDLEAIPVDPAAVQTKDSSKGSGLLLWGLGAGALLWGLDKVLSKPAPRSAPAYANGRKRGRK